MNIFFDYKVFKIFGFLLRNELLWQIFVFSDFLASGEIRLFQIRNEKQNL